MTRIDRANATSRRRSSIFPFWSFWLTAPGRNPRPAGDDSATNGVRRGHSRARLRDAVRPLQRSGCSSARNGRTHRSGERGSPGTLQSGGAGRGCPGFRGVRARRRRLRWYSSSTSAWPLFRMARFGTRTRSRPAGAITRLNVSRKSRFARLRATAPPRRRLAARPSRDPSPWDGAAQRVKSGPSTFAPWRKTRRNSEPRRSRDSFGKRFFFRLRRSGACAPGPDAASAPGVRPWCASAPGTRGFASAFGCSAGTSSSSGTSLRRPKILLPAGGRMTDTLGKAPV